MSFCASLGKLCHWSKTCTMPSGCVYLSFSPYSTLYITVSVVGGGGVRSCVLRIVGPGSGITSVSSPPVWVFGGALAGGGGLPCSGGNCTSRCANSDAGIARHSSSKRAARECREALECGGLTPLFFSAERVWNVSLPS